MQIEKEDATERWICEEPFGEAEEKVLDHCHYIDKILSSAHNRCSIKRKTTHFNPVVAHNLSNYGLHCIVRSLSKSNPHNLFSVIPSTEEKILYLTISVLIKHTETNTGNIDPSTQNKIGSPFMAEVPKAISASRRLRMQT